MREKWPSMGPTPASSVPLISWDASANTLVAYTVWSQTFSQNVRLHLTPLIPVPNANLLHLHLNFCKIFGLTVKLTAMPSVQTHLILVSHCISPLPVVLYNHHHHHHHLIIIIIINNRIRRKEKLNHHWYSLGRCSCRKRAVMRIQLNWRKWRIHVTWK